MNELISNKVWYRFWRIMIGFNLSFTVVTLLPPTEWNGVRLGIALTLLAVVFTLLAKNRLDKEIE